MSTDTETENCVETGESENLFFSSMYFCAHIAQNLDENFIFCIFKAIFCGWTTLHFFSRKRAFSAKNLQILNDVENFNQDFSIKTNSFAHKMTYKASYT
jgi:hypothetical protein